jgi:hypothetical protein
LCGPVERKLAPQWRIWLARTYPVERSSKLVLIGGIYYSKRELSVDGQACACVYHHKKGGVVNDPYTLGIGDRIIDMNCLPSRLIGLASNTNLYHTCGRTSFTILSVLTHINL